ncbi:MAG: MFS transporter, partial [Ktedonobacterales bacterium]
MSTLQGASSASPTPQHRLSRDFWTFWTGQTISNLGTSFTLCALPLLVYKLTGSALNLAIPTAANMLPYLLFGLVIGAGVDRLNRKRLMITVDLTRALV